MTKDEDLTLEALKYAASMGHGRMVRGMFAPFTIKEALAVHPRKAQGEKHMTQEALKLALEDYKKNERHNTVAETRYWCNQYKLLAEQALAQPSDSVEKPIDFELAYGGIYKDQRAALAKSLAQPEQEPIREVLKQVLELTESMVLHCDAELKIDFADFLIIAQAVAAKLKEDNK